VCPEGLILEVIEESLSGGIGPPNVALGPLIIRLLAEKIIDRNLIGIGHLKEAFNFRPGHIQDPDSPCRDFGHTNSLGIP
jgi:hypothetical protein